MAAISSTPKFTVTPDPADSTQMIGSVEYDVQFDPYDRDSNQGYTETLRVEGVDIILGEDSLDDLITTVTSNVVVRSNGQSNLHRVSSFKVSRSRLDEDKPPVPNPDEVRVRVALTPIQPFGGNAFSNIVTLSLP